MVKGRSAPAIFHLFHLMVHKLSTKFLQLTQKLLYFLSIQQKIDIILIHSHHMTVVVLAVDIFI